MEECSHTVITLIASCLIKQKQYLTTNNKIFDRERSDSTNDILVRVRKSERVGGWSKSKLRRRFQSNETLDPVFVGVLEKSVPNDFIKTQTNPSVFVQKHPLCRRFPANVFHSPCYDKDGFCHCKKIQQTLNESLIS